MSVQKLPDFHHALSLSRGGLDAADLAESHGVLCGMICSEAGGAASDFLGYLESQQVMVEPGTGLHEIMLEAADSTRQQLDDDDLGFQLWLPDDDEDLDDRTGALSQWCTGFLAGLALNGNLPDLSAEAAEAMEDIQQIATAAYDDGDDLAPEDDANEADEQAFCEIVEYVRVIALLLREELRGPRADEPIH
jgi:hypothetical protein